MSHPISTIALAPAEHAFRGALNRAVQRGLRIVEGVKLARDGQHLVGVCVLGAAELDVHATKNVLPRMPPGARGALADGFDGLAMDRDLDDGLGAWHALGLRLRRAYQPRKAT